ncbi:hypothetical protein [Tropicibacter sp. S64]|uniref:hypothetical protein n=1 Tax=Tropicibacter sp. S64 TaxID=3415122 RepID=UPI003C7D07A2
MTQPISAATRRNIRDWGLESKLFSVSRFKDKVAIVAGGELPLAQSLVRRLAEFGATVVALGDDAEILWRLARQYPGAVQTLTLGRGWREVLRLLQEAWAEEPIDLYIDLLPLAESHSLSETRDVFSRSAALASALLPGMRAGQAQAVLCFPQARAGAPNRGTRAAGYAGLVRHFNENCLPGRFLGLNFNDADCAWTDADCLSAGDAILMLCHPVSRGVQPGTVLAWTA